MQTMFGPRRTAWLLGAVSLGATLALIVTLMVAPPGATAGDPTDEDFNGINVVSAEERDDFGVEFDTGLWKSRFINGLAFVPESSIVNYGYVGGGCIRASGDMRTDLHLPHGATIISVEFLWRQNQPGTTQLQLWSHGDGPTGGIAPGATQLLSLESEADANYGSTQVVLTGGDQIQVDNVSSNYQLRWRGDGDTSFILLCGVRIGYQLDTDGEKVFTPIEPCAIFDTRPSQGGQGKPENQDQLTIDTVSSDFSTQGGADGDCDIPSNSVLGRNTNAALLVNLVALEPEGSGNLRAWDAGSPPQGGVLVYNPGQNNANAVVVENRTGIFGSNNEFQVQVNGAPTHVRAVVLGYYSDIPQNQY